MSGQPPAGGPQPPPSNAAQAFQDSNVAQDTFTPSEAATVLLSVTAAPAAPTTQTIDNTATATAATTATTTTTAAAQAPADTTQPANTPAQIPVPTPAQEAATTPQFLEQFQGPPPYTETRLAYYERYQDRHPETLQNFTAHQLRQFNQLLDTLRGISSALIPSFSYSA